MKTFTMRYPGDPPLRIEELTREQFFERFPPETRVMTIGVPGEPPDAVIPFGETLCCDCCNADPGDVLYLLAGTRAYCTRCFNELAEYVTENRQP